MAWIAADSPGFLRIELYNGGQLFYTSGIFGVGGIGNFGGLVSDQLFDMAVLMDFPAGSQAEIDAGRFTERDRFEFTSQMDGDDTRSTLVEPVEPRGSMDPQ